MVDLFLGRVDLAADGERHMNAHLQPLYQSQPDKDNNLIWKRIDNVQERFPNRGLVTWFNAPTEAKKDTIWQFTAEEAHYDPNNINHNSYKTRTNPNIPEEIIDLRGLGDEDQIRERVSTEGISLDFLPAKRVYLWIENEIWIGPVQLIAPARPGEDLWKLDTSQPLSCWHPTAQDDIQKLSIGGSKRLFLAPRAKPGNRIGQLDWAPINLILKRVLQRLRRIDPAYKNELQLTDQIITRITNVIETGGLDGTNAYLENNRLKRARDIINILESRQELVDELTEDILEIPSVRKEIEAAKSDARTKAIDEIDSELAEKKFLVEDKHKEVTSLNEEKTKLLSDISDLKDELEAKKQSFERDLESALSESIAQLKVQPEKLIVDSIILRAAFGSNLQSSTDNKNDLESSVNTEQRTAPLNSLSFPQGIDLEIDGVTTLNSIPEFQKALQNSLYAKDLKNTLARPLHSAFLSGAFPILYGSSSYEILESYASVVAGKRLLWLPISATTLDPTDLLGKYIPNLNRFVPQSGGLLDLLLLAKKTDDIYLVVLDGINRSAIDAYLSPLISCYSDARREGTQRGLPLFPPNSLPDDDPYHAASWLYWPSNVLLAGILSDGVTTILPPPTFWDSAVLIEAESPQPSTSGKPGGHSGIDAGSQVCSVSLDIWREWVIRIEDDSRKPGSEVKGLFKYLDTDNTNFRQHNQSLYYKFHQALLHWPETTNAIEDLIVHSMVPKAVSSHQDELLIEALKRESLFSKRIETAFQLTRQVLS